MTWARASMGAIIVKPAALTLTSTMVALDDLLISPDIAIFALPQASVSTRKNLSTGGVALEILRRHVHRAGNGNRVLASWNISFYLFFAADLREILYLVTLQARPHMAAQEGNIKEFHLTLLLTFLATWPRAWMITTGFGLSAGFKADDGIMQRLRMAFVNTGMSAGKP